MNETKRKGDWIQTFTGKQFWPLDPRPEDIDVRDIAHALSNICRFTGHSKAFYSVAQHSVLASLNVHPDSALPALLHDAAEAYMGDIARPFKRYLWIGESAHDDFTERFKTIELRILALILATFDCPPIGNPVWKEVERIDQTMLVTEARDFMAPLATNWRHQEKNGFEILQERISPWTPGRAEHEFLRRFTELKGKQ